MHSRLQYLLVTLLFCFLPAYAESQPPAGYDQALKLFNLGKYVQAQKSFEGFVNHGVADGNTRYYLGHCYYTQKQYGKALAQFDWVAKQAKSISLQRQAERQAHTIRCYQQGICPGNCLKLSMPGWRKMYVPGKPDHLRWMLFRSHGSWEGWSTDHIGEVIEYVNGNPVNKGKCPICIGTTRVPILR